MRNLTLVFRRGVFGAGPFLALVTGLLAASDYAKPYTFSTLAGAASIGSEDGNGPNARFYSPRAVAVDATGNSYIVDTGNHIIRKITPAGTVSTFAGQAGDLGATDGTGAQARFNSPQDIVIDATGNLYVTDTGNQTIRKITPAGAVTTLAGGAGIAGKIDGIAGAARFDTPLGLAIDSSGNLFVTEEGNGSIRKITPGGAVSTYASDLRISDPYYDAIAVDAAGTVYLSWYAFRDYQDYYINGILQPQEVVRDIGFLTQVSPDGTKTYLAQTTRTIAPPALADDANVITDIVAESAGSLVLAMGRRLTRFSVPGNKFTDISGSGGAGSDDGPADLARFSTQYTLAIDPTGGFVVADSGNNTVRRVSASGTVTPGAGLAFDKVYLSRDGTGANARFIAAAGMAIDPAGNLYVADTTADCIRKITPTGEVTTLAGSPGIAGTADGTGLDARFNHPFSVALAPTGDLYVADTNNSAIRRLSATGVVTTVAGNSVFRYPRGVAVTAGGIVLVADTGNSSIRRIMDDGSVQTLYGLTGESGTVDGPWSSARFTAPTGITVAPSGNLYVTEASSTPSIARVRRITGDGMVTTVAGAEEGYTDGQGTAARFRRPTALAVDAGENLFVSDADNQVVRRITATGAVSTVAGLVDAPGSSEGTGRNARFLSPEGIAIDGSGNLFVSCLTSIRRGSLALLPTITTQPASQTVAAGGSVTFSVTANSPATPHYQWSFNGVAISGATNSTLNLAAARTTDAGDYAVTVSNDAGSVISNAAKLTVNPPVTPPPVSGKGGGGGGAPSWWFAGALALLTGLRSLRICIRRAP